MMNPAKTQSQLVSIWSPSSPFVLTKSRNVPSITSIVASKFWENSTLEFMLYDNYIYAHPVWSLVLSIIQNPIHITHQHTMVLPSTQKMHFEINSDPVGTDTGLPSYRIFGRMKYVCEFWEIKYYGRTKHKLVTVLGLVYVIRSF